MPKLLQSFSGSAASYGPSSDESVNRLIRRRAYGRLGAAGSFEPTSSSGWFFVRVPRRLRILGLGSRRYHASHGGTQLQLIKSGKPDGQASSTMFGRLRDAYERVMMRAAAKSGELSTIPFAKASRVPLTLATALGSREGAMVDELNPGFKMTCAEKKYLEHLRRTASRGRF